MAIATLMMTSCVSSEQFHSDTLSLTLLCKKKSQRNIWHKSKVPSDILTYKFKKEQRHIY